MEKVGVKLILVVDKVSGGVMVEILFKLIVILIQLNVILRDNGEQLLFGLIVVISDNFEMLMVVVFFVKREGNKEEMFDIFVFQDRLDSFGLIVKQLIVVLFEFLCEVIFFVLLVESQENMLGDDQMYLLII